MTQEVQNCSRLNNLQLATQFSRCPFLLTTSGGNILPKINFPSFAQIEKLLRMENGEVEYISKFACQKLYFF